MAQKDYCYCIGKNCETIDTYLRQAYQYDYTFSDDELREIASLAKVTGKDERIPLYVLQRREENNQDLFLSYADLKLDFVRTGSARNSATVPDFGEVEAWTEKDQVIFSMNGIDDDGSWSCSTVLNVKEFLVLPSKEIQSYLNAALFYNKQYEV